MALAHWTRTGTRRVLVVDDSAANRAYAQAMLRRIGIGSDAVENGAIAVERVRKNRYDLILMDIQLPEVSGLDVTRWLKEDDDLRHIPVVAVTAFAMKGDEERIRSGGCEAYISKPISVAHFLDTVRTFVGEA